LFVAGGIQQLVQLRGVGGTQLVEPAAIGVGVDQLGAVAQGTIDRHHLAADRRVDRSEEHTSELQSRENVVCRLLLEKKNKHTTPSKALPVPAPPIPLRANPYCQRWLQPGPASGLSNRRSRPRRLSDHRELAYIPACL